MPHKSRLDAKQSTGYHVDDFCTVLQSTIISTSDDNVALKRLPQNAAVLNVVAPDTQNIVAACVKIGRHDDCRVYGINGEQAFFTSAQIFHTTTGLRAVDALAARTIRPDIEIGYLKPGHIVYRLQDDRSNYHRVQIKTIESIITRESRALLDTQAIPLSFHAYGYLLLSIQPDMSVLSTGTILSNLSTEQRLDSLRGIEELAPVFQKLGNHGVSQLLQREVGQKKYRLTPRSKPTRRPFAEPLNQVKRTYSLLYATNTHIEIPGITYRLPKLNFFEGVLTVDGQMDQRCSTDSAQRSVRWTRKLNDTWFEHASIRFFEHNLSGTGALFVSKNGDLNRVPEDTIVTPIRVVKLTPLQLPEHEPEDSYNMIVDMDPWPKYEDDKPNPTKPLNFGVIQLTQQQIGGNLGLDAPTLQVPILDKLCQTINNTFSKDEKAPVVSIESLYESTANLAGRSERTVIITMKNAALLAQLADPFDWDRPFELTFKKTLGSDLLLPVLFQEFSATISDDTVSGALYRFDPTMRGGLGQRHLLVSDIAGTSNAVVTRARTALSRSSLPVSVDNNVSGQLPAPVTHYLDAAFAPSVQDLLDLPDYNDVTTLICNAMLYHMDEDQRVNILKIDKRPAVPTDLPRELADDLAPRLIEWLKNTYAPAYICNQLAQIDPSITADWIHKFTPEQKLKIRYWWSGRGQKCLANEEKYTEVSQIAARSATLRNYPKLQKYLGNASQWAQDTIDCLSNFTCLRSLTRTPIEGGVNYGNMYSNVIAVLDPRGTYTSEYFNAIFSHNLSNCFRAAYILTDAASLEENQAWLTDSITRIGVAVLDEDSSPDGLCLSSRMRAALLSDIQRLEKNLDLPGTGSPEHRMKEIIDRQEDLVNALSWSMSPFTEQPSQGSSGTDGELSGPSSIVDPIIAKGQAAYEWVQTAYAQASNKVFPDGSPNLILFKGFATFGMVGKYIYDCVTGFSQWKTDDAVERSILVENSLEGALGCAEKAFGVWEEWKTLIDDRKAIAEAAMLNELGDIEMEDFASKLSRDMTGLEGNNSTQKAVSAQAAESGEPEAIAARVAEDFERPMTQEMSQEFRSLQISKYFGNAETWFGFAQIILSIGTVISMSMQLKEQWNDLNTFGKTLGIIQISVTALTILCNDTITAGLVAFEIIAAEGTMAVVLPGIGTVLAVVGILVGLLAVLFETKKKPPPPPLPPTQKFIRDTGGPMVDKWDEQPKQRLEYNMPSSVSSSGSLPSQFVIKATNNSGSVIFVPRVTFTFLSGDDEKVASLFKDDTFAVVERTSIFRNNDGKIYTGMADEIRAYLVPNPREDAKATSFDLSVTGVSNELYNNPQGYIRLQNGFSFSVTISGFIAKGTSTLLQIVEHLVSPIKDENWNQMTIKIV